MNPLVEHALVTVIIMGAIGYLLSRFIHKRRAGKGCGSGCGCGTAAKQPPSK